MFKWKKNENENKSFVKALKIHRSYGSGFTIIHSSEKKNEYFLISWEKIGNNVFNISEWMVSV